MKQKVEIMSMTDEILSPITKASNVLLEDGSNVQQLIDNYVEPEFTPTIEASSSMSKVGQGDSVDFSANVINGAYESCVLKGKTLVNYNAEGNDRNEYVCTENADDAKYQAFIKPSTKYSIVFNRTVASDGLTVDLGGATANVVSTTVGKTIVQITTLPTLSHNYVKFLGVGNVIKDVQVIEGDVADDIEYFEGMIDVENPVVTNCNMLDVDSVDYKSNTISTNEVVLRSLPNGVCDTLDLMTGEYVQRIGEREYQSGDESNSQVSTDKVNTQYQLETPITTTIDLKQHPYAYKDGYINLSSNGEISLAPSIEYSLPINRSGQVTINTQLVQKQQKQLDELESMIIANMVNTQYKQTLSNVEYMLGGE